jgi:hypothetical protein
MSKKLLLGKEKKVKTEDKSSFTYAAAEAALADKKTFDFDGKEYPVEISKEKAKEIVNEEYEFFMEQVEEFDISPLEDYVQNKNTYKNMGELSKNYPDLFEKIVQTTVKVLDAAGITPPAVSVLRSKFAAREAVPEIRQLQQQIGAGSDGKVGPNTFSKMVTFYNNLEKKKPAIPPKSWSETLADFNRQVKTVKDFFGNIPKNWLDGLANSIGMISSSSSVASKMQGILGSLGLVAIPLSVILAVGLAGRFGWRKYIRSRERAQLARAFANDGDIYKVLEAKAKEAVKDIPNFDEILLKEIIRKTEAAEKRFGI